jgi:hypothetical protein
LVDQNDVSLLFNAAVADGADIGIDVRYVVGAVVGILPNRALKDLPYTSAQISACFFFQFSGLESTSNQAYSCEGATNRLCENEGCEDPSVPIGPPLP